AAYRMRPLSSWWPTLHLARVGGVLVNIAMRQVAAPGSCLIWAIAQCNVDSDIHRLHRGLRLGWVVARCAATRDELHAVDGEGNVLVAEVGAARAQRRDDPPPVGIAARDGALPDRRGGDGPRRAARITLRPRAPCVDDHQVGCPFAVARHLARQI